MTLQPIRVLIAAPPGHPLTELRAAFPVDRGSIVSECSSVDDAAAALAAGEFDVVLVDPTLPEAGRIEVLARDHADRRGSPVAIITDPADRERHYRSLFEQSRDAIFMANARGNTTELNQAALDLFGCGLEDLIGRSFLTLCAEPQDRQRARAELEARSFVRDLEVRILRSDGHERWCLLSAWVRRGRDGALSGYQGILHDISGRKHMEEQLAHEAFHDGLTGLPNRALFMDRLERAVARRRRGEERDLAVLFLDLDRFKVINDSLGHSAGDELLRLFGALLQREIRTEDTVARMGGDEFAILLDGVSDAVNPTHVAQRIQDRIRTPFTVLGRDIFTSVSIGIAFGGGATEQPEDLLREADMAMYRAKEVGPARYQIFDQAMHAHAVTLLQLETDLRLALDRREFVLHYQPVMDLEADRLAGFEALIRWQHPQHGLLQPHDFIPLAEDTGLIGDLGEWVLRQAARQLSDWRKRAAGNHDIFMCVNVSARQFTLADLVDTVGRILHETGIPGHLLRLELTESAVMQSPDAAVRILSALRDLGVGLSIDDFGTGYSSLNYLHNFPIDTLKIDRSFISRLEEEGEAGMVQTIMALARNLGMKAIAEGVETENQLLRLRQLGSTSVQGFLFSTALDEPAASSLLDQRLPAQTRADPSDENPQR
jgi:diguanylate cyclase (GGDEF)-like protein/PAS domain S-box-containing protein